MSVPNEQGGEHVKKNSPLRLVIEILLIVIVAIGLATLFTRFVMQPYEIPSGSM